MDIPFRSRLASRPPPCYTPPMPQPVPPSETPPSPPPRRARLQAAAALLVLAAGLALTAGATLSLRHQARRQARRDFEAEAESAHQRTLRELQLYMEVLDSIRRLHGLSDQVSTAAFEEIVHKGMLHQQRVLGAYGFAQVVPAADRAAAERQGSPVVESDGRGGYTSAPPRAAYFPLTYQTPPGGLGVPNGYDFGSEPAGQEALSLMFRHAIFTIAPATPSPAAPDAEYRLFAPTLYLTDGGTAIPSGFAVSLFRPAPLLATAADGLRGLALRLLPPGPAADAARTAADANTAADTRWLLARDVALGHQLWLFAADSDASYWLALSPRRPLAAAALGTLLSLALFLWLWGTARQTAQVERLVRRRTAQLADANRRLAALMEDRRQLEATVLRAGEEERTRIGRDLHDSLGQKLTGVLYLFTAWRRKAAPPGTPADTPEADQIASTLKDAVTQVRRIARGLAPLALTGDGLPDALRNLAEESSALYPASVDFYYEREGRPRDDAAAEHLYLIAQEAIANAVRHGRATRVAVSLDFAPEGGILAVEDNGCGLDAATPPDPNGPAGNGLRIMRHRADILGATLDISSSPSGTRLAVTFPA